MTHSDLWRAIDKLTQQAVKLRATRTTERALAITPKNPKK